MRRVLEDTPRVKLAQLRLLPSWPKIKEAGQTKLDALVETHLAS